MKLFRAYRLCQLLLFISILNSIPSVVAATDEKKVTLIFAPVSNCSKENGCFLTKEFYKGQHGGLVVPLDLEGKVTYTIDGYDGIKVGQDIICGNNKRIYEVTKDTLSSTQPIAISIPAGCDKDDYKSFH